MSDLLTHEELAAIAEREAKATPPVVYFINSPDTGFDEYATLKEALDAAEETISNYRDEAMDGWNEEVTSIRVGIITHDVEQFDVKHRKDCGEDENWACPNCDEMCDYRMSSDGDLLALLNIACADRTALLRHIAALEARTPANDPELDSTDFAHPAWWRGHHQTTEMFCRHVQAILDGRDVKDESVVPEPWHTIRQRLLALVENLAPATDVDALLAEAEEQLKAWKYNGHLDDWRGAEMSLCAVIKRLATALRESRAREVAAEKKYQRLFEPWDEVNGWCEHNHQFSYRLDDEDNSDGCMQCERDAAIARAEKAEADLADLTQTTGELCPECHWRGVRDDGCEFCKAHRLEADLAAARKELAGLEGGGVGDTDSTRCVGSCKSARRRGCERPRHPRREGGPMKYRKKPIAIDAMQFTGDNYFALMRWAEARAGECRWHFDSLPNPQVAITTLEGIMRADVGDWIIIGVKGEQYPCKPDIFEATYEPLEGGTQ